jgi:hypothetical protein
VRTPIALIESDVDLIVDRFMRAKSRIFFASPFIGRTPASLFADRIAALRGSRPGLDIRGLTSLNKAMLLNGYSSAAGLASLLEADVEIRAIQNLHAKLVVVDRWAIVGSANLTTSGLDAGNLELGWQMSGHNADLVADRFLAWWQKHTSERSRVKIEHLPKSLRELPPTREPSVDGGLGQRALLERGEALKAHAKVVDLKEALVRLEKDCKGPRTSSRATSFPKRQSKGYRDCARLRVLRETPEQNAIARTILLKVLRDHTERDARAHAAYRLAHDMPDAKAIAEIERALRTAYGTDRAYHVRLRARHALAHLGIELPQPEPVSTTG